MQVFADALASEEETSEAIRVLRRTVFTFLPGIWAVVRHGHLEIAEKEHFAMSVRCVEEPILLGNLEHPPTRVLRRLCSIVAGALDELSVRIQRWCSIAHCLRNTSEDVSDDGGRVLDLAAGKDSENPAVPLAFPKPACGCYCAPSPVPSELDRLHAYGYLEPSFRP